MANALSALALALSGYNQGQDLRRQREIQDAELAYQQQARERQRQMQEMQMAQQKAGGLQQALAAMIGRNNESAAGLLPEFYQNFNQAYGTNLAGPSIQGASNPNVYDINTQQPMRDFTGQATTDALRSAAMLPTPKPNLIEVSPDASLYDPTKGGFVGTAPGRQDPMAELRAKLIEAQIGATQARATASQASAARANRTPVGRASKPRMGWVVENGQKVWRELTPGTVSEGATPKTEKPRTRKQIIDEVDAELRAEKPDSLTATPEEKAAYVERRNRMIRQRAKQQGAGRPQPKPTPAPAAKSSEDAAFDAWVQKSLKGK